MPTMQNPSVLVLNQNYEPLNICGARRAIGLYLREKAEMLENGRGMVHTATAAFPIPSVIRLRRMIKRPLMTLRLSRREVFWRDGYACQYCGQSTRELTLDHVVPRVRGGVHSWENVVSACIPCNHRKAGRTPKDAGMVLLKEPRVPRANPYYLFARQPLLEEWKRFIPWVVASPRRAP